jgi:hypothetical protein
MPKLERLLELARMTRNRGVRNIREMSRTCGVSQRTIYRYLNTLSAVDVPRVLQNGDERAGRAAPAAGLDADDRCLIRHLLDHNPLVHESYFVPRLDRLRQLLAPSPSSAGRRLRGRVLEVSLARSSRRQSRGDGRLEMFTRACLRGWNLSVVTRTGRGLAVTLRPEAVRLSDQAIQFRFRNLATGRMIRLDLDDILSLRTVTGERGSRRRVGATGKKG